MNISGINERTAVREDSLLSEYVYSVQTIFHRIFCISRNGYVSEHQNSVNRQEKCLAHKVVRKWKVLPFFPFQHSSIVPEICLTDRFPHVKIVNYMGLVLGGKIIENVKNMNMHKMQYMKQLILT